MAHHLPGIFQQVVHPRVGEQKVLHHQTENVRQAGDVLEVFLLHCGHQVGSIIGHHITHFQASGGQPPPLLHPEGGQDACLLLLISVSGDQSQNISSNPLPSILLGVMLVVPYVLTLLKTLWKMVFSHSPTPDKLRLIKFCLAESLVATASSMLVIVVMPHFSIFTNTMILSSVYFCPSALQIFYGFRNQNFKWIMSIISLCFLVIGHILFLTSYAFNRESQHIAFYFGAAIATIFISLNWYENFTPTGTGMESEKEPNENNILYICGSLLKIVITVSSMVGYIGIKREDWSTVSTINPNERNLLIGLFVVQIVSSASCHWFGVVSLKMQKVKLCFYIPYISATLTVALAFIVIFTSNYTEERDAHIYLNMSYFCHNLQYVGSATFPEQLVFEVRQNFCQFLVMKNITFIVLMAISNIFWYIGSIFATLDVFNLRVERIERTTSLFFRRMYEAAFIDQSMLLNTRRNHTQNSADGNTDKEKVKVYLCATMWHETKDEMLKALGSMFRLDKFKTSKKDDTFSFEAHIFFDDAFTEDSKCENGRKKRHVNEFVETLISVIEEVYSVFKGRDEEDVLRSTRHSIRSTPYGGRLHYKFPGGNSLFVHLKDKKRIRNKKRWSQIKKSNTYILALDGDTDYQPSALMLLVDRLRTYPKVGAACGRIHPTGPGPMVWYQKFEYAVGHWLQKSSEHVFGCVLCSPGCFSLFRASALLDVLTTYNKKAEGPSDYIQYDQGEDRWLCTLLLQHGWRVEYNAAADAYTNAPMEFQEFYNQRRRWGPSTMANILDLLQTGKETSKKNPSISFLYILYLTLSMSSSILSPAAVCLMLAGAFSFLFHWDMNVSIVIAIIPPACFVAVCFLVKPNTQIIVAAFLSVFYAFLMTATFLSIIADLVKQETFVTPEGIFLIGLSLIYIMTALLHPQEFFLLIYGLVYIICVPSGYLLLTIYSLVNMHVVSWGTRESATPKDNVKGNNQGNLKHQKSCKCLCWDIDVMVHDNKCDKEEHRTDIEQEEKQPMDSSSDDSKNSKEEDIYTYEECWITQLQMKMKCSFLKQKQLMLEEDLFWKDLIEQYLKPISMDKEEQDKTEKELKTFRNKMTFLFFMINMLWIVATFFLQIIGSSVRIAIPKLYANGTVSPTEKLYVDPTGLMFLLTFAILLLLQFGALLYHRIYSAIHFIAYKETQ
ncbi:chitin synthase chs-2-like [Hyperolius riggenbachi]|uniref:chitin synthase chs-2-like n=1 Tax=Hyperolius riggenbachi TaxID=752182 RepID=UPI0035A366A0